jgi:hypothetical protein
MTTITEQTETAASTSAEPKAAQPPRAAKPGANAAPKRVKATFTIDSENNVTAHAGLPPTGANEPFANLKDLTRLTAKWPISRLVDVWNSFAGVAPFNDLKPMKKFTNRDVALARIWEAIERLAPIVAQPAADVAPVKGKAKKNPPKAQRRDTARPGATSGKRPAPGARDGSKAAKILDLLKRPGGATSKELQKASGWQPHSVRGFLSGTVRKKMGLTVVSTKGEDGERCYSVKA